MKLAPIALFVYNRADHANRIIASLKSNFLSANSEIYIFSDAAKYPGDEKKVAEVRRIIRLVEGFSAIHIIERSENYGVAKSITDGVSSLCKSHGRVIVVEDDLILSREFLKFMNYSLDLYQRNDDIFQVSGYMFPIDVSTSKSVIFLPLISCWGWGVWDRSWRLLDADMNMLPSLERDVRLKNKFNFNDTYPYYSMAVKQKKHEIDSWGIAWYLTVFMRNGLVLYPPHSLVENVGVDSSGTHGRGHSELQARVNEATMDGFIFPTTEMIGFDEKSMRGIENLFRSMQKGLFRRLFDRIFK